MASHRPGSLARRSAALLGEFTMLRADDALCLLIERQYDAIGGMLGRHWQQLGDHLRSEDGTYPAAYAWRAGYALHHLGHLGDAARIVDSADTSTSSDTDRSRLASAAAATWWSRGRRDRCAAEVEEATKFARAADDPGAEAMALVVAALLAASDGDRDHNLQCYEQALSLAEEAGDLLTVERVCNNLGSRSLEEGRHAEALEHLGHGVEVNEHTGHLSGLAVLRHNMADALAGLGRLDEALLASDNSRDLWTALEAPSVDVAWHQRGEIQLARGNATQAAMAFAQAAQIAANEDDLQTLAVAMASRACALVSTDREEAVTLADQALALDVPIGHAIPLVLAGWVKLAAGDAQSARELAQRAMTTAEMHRDLPRLADALELAALSNDPGDDEMSSDAQLREAADIWRELDHPLRRLTNELVVARRRRDRLRETVAAEKLRSLGVHDDVWRVAGPLHAVSARDHTRIRIHVLGMFGVDVGGEPLPASAWPSRKAKEVVRVLAVRGDRGISRERLGGFVWPDADAVGNRLSVALSHIRSVLDPGREHPPDHYVVAERDVLRLNLPHVDVDVLDFAVAAEEALAAARAGAPDAIAMLQTAAAMHGGDLCEDDPAAEWVAPERDRTDALGGEVLRALAAQLAGSEAPEEALPWFARLLAADPYDEATYGALITLLCGLGRFGEARRHHRGYALRMAELGVEPTPWRSFASSTPASRGHSADDQKT